MMSSLDMEEEELTLTREAVPVRKKRQRAVTAVRHWRKEQEGWVYSKVLEN